MGRALGPTGENGQIRGRLARMTTRMASSAPPPLRQALHDRISQLIEEVECLSAAKIDGRIGEARRETAYLLNQAFRHLRQASSEEEAGLALLDAAGSFATGAALFRVDGEAAAGESLRGGSEAAAAEFRGLRIPLTEAAALEAASRSGDPVVAAATPAEVSPQLVSLLSHPPESRVSVFPVMGAGGCRALLYAWGDVEGSALELLSQAAGAFWGGAPATAVDEEPEQLIAIAPVPATELLPVPEPAPVTEPAPPASPWAKLSPDERRLHLSAQRFARVQAAEMRLRHAADVRAGRARRDIYGALRKSIDIAREAFRKNFFAPCPSMVDYLHLELVRTLANDDAELLGKDYPGILA